eukprot:1215348-Rhodomonas_salina.6
MWGLCLLAGTENVVQWRAYFDSNTCFKDALPGEWDAKLNQFQKLLVLRSLRSDKVQEGLMDFVSTVRRPLDPLLSHVEQHCMQSHCCWRGMTMTMGLL